MRGISKAMRKFVVPLVSILVAAGSVLLFLQEGVAAKFAGVFLFLGVVAFYALWVSVLSNPQEAVEKLMLRRRELEIRTGRAPSDEEVLQAAADALAESEAAEAESKAQSAPGNRAARRASAKK